jgi:hypothetical protein
VGGSEKKWVQEREKRYEYRATVWFPCKLAVKNMRKKWYFGTPGTTGAQKGNPPTGWPGSKEDFFVSWFEEDSMKKSRITDSQIPATLKHAEAGSPIP